MRTIEGSKLSTWQPNAFPAVSILEEKITKATKVGYERKQDLLFSYCSSKFPTNSSSRSSKQCSHINK